jgi:hypothetical protein
MKIAGNNAGKGRLRKAAPVAVADAARTGGNACGESIDRIIEDFKNAPMPSKEDWEAFDLDVIVLDGMAR